MVREAVQGNRLRRLRAYLLMLLAIAILVGGCLAARYYLSLPTLGFSFGATDQVGEVEPGGPAERAGMTLGDRVVTIDGVSPLAGQPYVRHGQRAVALEVERNGQILALTIAPAPLSPKDWLNRIGYLLSAGTFWAMAVAVLAFKPHDGTAQVLILGLLLAAFGLVVLLLADGGLGWASLLTNSAVLALGALLVYLHTIFPERLQFQGKRVLLSLLYAIGLSLMLVVGLGRLVFHAAWATPAINASKAYFAACILAAVALMVRAYRGSTSRRARRQIGIIALGTVLGLVPLVIFILLPQIVPNLRYLTVWPAFLALACIPASYLYAMFRYDLMRIDRVVSQNAARLLLFLLLVALYVPVYAMLRRLARQVLPGAGDPAVGTLMASIVLIVILIASFQPLRRVTERLVYGLFYGGWYDYKSFVSQMTREFSAALDMPTIIDLLIKQVAGTMRLKAIALLMPFREGEGRYCVRVEKGFEPVLGDYSSKGLPGLLPKPGRPAAHEELRAQAKGTESEAELAPWAAAGAQWWIPLLHQGKLEGILVVGAKMTDEFLSGEDLDILDTLSHHAASAITRARQVKQLHDQVREIQNLSRKLLTVQDEIQEQIALEIHAEAMPSIVGVSRLLEDAGGTFEHDKVERAQEELQEILDYLRALMYDLRPPVLALTDLGEMLQQHGLSCQRRWDLPIGVHVSQDEAEVPDEVRIAVFRVFQESLNNTRNHAEAHRVEAVLDVTANRVYLEVRDDGVGFEVPEHLGELANGGHSGLLGMRERIQSVGGKWWVESELGRGTRIFADVPLRSTSGGS